MEPDDMQDEQDLNSSESKDNDIQEEERDYVPYSCLTDQVGGSRLPQSEVSLPGSCVPKMITRRSRTDGFTAETPSELSLTSRRRSRMQTKKLDPPQLWSFLACSSINKTTLHRLVSSSNNSFIPLKQAEEKDLQTTHQSSTDFTKRIQDLYKLLPRGKNSGKPQFAHPPSHQAMIGGFLLPETFPSGDHFGNAASSFIQQSDLDSELKLFFQRLFEHVSTSSFTFVPASQPIQTSTVSPQKSFCDQLLQTVPEVLSPPPAENQDCVTLLQYLTQQCNQRRITYHSSSCQCFFDFANSLRFLLLELCQLLTHPSIEPPPNAADDMVEEEINILLEKSLLENLSFEDFQKFLVPCLTRLIKLVHLLDHRTPAQSNTQVIEQKIASSYKMDEVQSIPIPNPQEAKALSIPAPQNRLAVVTPPSNQQEQGVSNVSGIKLLSLPKPTVQAPTLLNPQINFNIFLPVQPLQPDQIKQNKKQRLEPNSSS